MQENVFEAMPFSEICGDATVSTDGLVKVHTSNEELAGVTVSAIDADGTVMNATATTDLGFYAFDALPACQQVALQASLSDNDWTNGLDIFDMVDINLHLLGRQEFTNPYQLLAADANGDEELDVFDITTIARQILGITTSLLPAPAQPWFFVPAGYEFQNPAYPFAEAYPTRIDFSQVSPTEINQGFVAMKRGDVNADAILNVSNLPIGLTVELSDAPLPVGEQGLVEVHFTGQDLAGFQLKLQTEGLRLLGVVHSDLPADAYRLEDGSLQLLNLETGATEHSMVLRVQALQAGNAKEMFTLAENAGQSVAVGRNGDPLRIDLGAAAGASESSLGSSVYPNPFADVLTLNLSAPLATPVNLELLDVSGRLLQARQLPVGTENTRLEGLALPAGTYLLRLVNEKGEVMLARVLEAVAAR